MLAPPTSPFATCYVTPQVRAFGHRDMMPTDGHPLAQYLFAFVSGHDCPALSTSMASGASRGIHVRGRLRFGASHPNRPSNALMVSSVCNVSVVIKPRTSTPMLPERPDHAQSANVNDLQPTDLPPTHEDGPRLQGIG